jgi:hypothetical protein
MSVGVVALSACAAQRTTPARPTAPTTDAAPAAPPTAGKVTFACEPAEAEIRVDGTSVGQAAAINARGGLPLPFGAHRFEIAHPEHETLRLELNIGEKPEVIRVKLQPLRPTP